MNARQHPLPVCMENWSYPQKCLCIIRGDLVHEANQFTPCVTTTTAIYSGGGHIKNKKRLERRRAVGRLRKPTVIFISTPSCIHLTHLQKGLRIGNETYEDQALKDFICKLAL